MVFDPIILRLTLNYGDVVVLDSIMGLFYKPGKYVFWNKNSHLKSPEYFQKNLIYLFCFITNKHRKQLVKGTGPR